MHCDHAAAGRPVVVIPAYKPAALLAGMVAELVRSPGIRAVVVVNDGSGSDFEHVFQALAGLERVHLLRHIVNLGKGAALKTGLNYVACTFPDSVGVVTADADGQHAVKDILRTADALVEHPQDLVLGARQFEGEVPVRSKLGNVITRHVLRAVTGQKISDTQTGLRGIPMSFIPTVLRLQPNGYDYELEVLLASKPALRPINEIAIDTIYHAGNSSSHFNPLLDSMRIYFVLIRFASVSLSTAVLDNIVFLAAFHFFPHLLACQVLGRAVAGLFNYSLNKTSVFHARVRDAQAMPKYWFSVLVFGALSFGLIKLLLSAGFAVPSAKVTAETILFAVSFIVQRDFVFASRRRAQEAGGE
jgi:glycosyltransferase involved in cell wall biosynthesis